MTRPTGNPPGRPRKDRVLEFLRRREYKRKQPTWRECEWCGGRYQAVRSNREFCTNGCRSNNVSLERRAGRTPLGEPHPSVWEMDMRQARVERMAHLLETDETVDWDGLSLRFNLSEEEQRSFQKAVQKYRSERRRETRMAA